MTPARSPHHRYLVSAAGRAGTDAEAFLVLKDALLRGAALWRGGSRGVVVTDTRTGQTWHLSPPESAEAKAVLDDVTGA